VSFARIGIYLLAAACPALSSGTRRRRLPFEFLLFSLAREFGPRTVLRPAVIGGGWGAAAHDRDGLTDAWPDRTSRHATTIVRADLILPLAKSLHVLTVSVTRSAVHVEPHALLVGVRNGANKSCRSAATPPLPSQAGCALAAVLTNRSDEYLYVLGRRTVICVRRRRLIPNCLLWRLPTSAWASARRSGGQDKNYGGSPLVSSIGSRG
jgi:hypothetical protein